MPRGADNTMMKQEKEEPERSNAKDRACDGLMWRRTRFTRASGVEETLELMDHRWKRRQRMIGCPMMLHVP